MYLLAPSCYHYMEHPGYCTNRTLSQVFLCKSLLFQGENVTGQDLGKCHSSINWGVFHYNDIWMSNWLTQYALSPPAHQWWAWCSTSLDFLHHQLYIPLTSQSLAPLTIVQWTWPNPLMRYYRGATRYQKILLLSYESLYKTSYCFTSRDQLYYAWPTIPSY